MRYSGVRRAPLLVCAAVFAVPCVPAWAQETGDAPPPVATPPATVEGAKRYTPADFARFAPKTAMDMLNQVPGFIIVQEGERRGLGQATTNVLINGQRFSGKSNDVVTELSRVSAGDVVRIDIVDGAALDVPGLSGQVANIIVNARKAVSGQFVWNPQTRFKRLPPRITNGQASISGSAGAFEYTFSVRNNSQVNGNAGPELVTAGNGTVIDTRQERLDVFVEEPAVAASLKHKGASGSVANLNASYQRYLFDANETSLRSGAGQPDRNRLFHEEEREWNYEIGGDYEFALGKGRLKTIGLRRVEHSPYVQFAIERYADGRASTGSRFESIQHEGEAILRGEYRWKSGPADWQVAAEGALNTLDIDNRLGSLLEGGGFGMKPLSAAEVEEKRAELSVTYGRSLSPSLTLQASAGGEYSRLAQKGANGKTRVFYRPKGFVSLGWKPSARWDVSAKLERVVGQLRFADFVDSTNVGSGIDTAGNPDLVPQQSWNGTVEATRNLGIYGTVTGRLFGRLLSDVVDIVPIGETGQAPGNLDSATLVGAFVSSTVNLDPFGVKGAKIDFEMQLQKSSIEDQLTGVTRNINNLTLRTVSASFRHDIPSTDWAYGGSYYEFEQDFGYRLDIRERPSNAPGSLGMFVEHKDVLGLKIRASLDNLLGTNETYVRTFYDRRRTNPILFTEYRDRDFGPILTFSISGQI